MGLIRIILATPLLRYLELLFLFRHRAGAGLKASRTAPLPRAILACECRETTAPPSSPLEDLYSTPQTLPPGTRRTHASAQSNLHGADSVSKKIGLSPPIFRHWPSFLAIANSKFVSHNLYTHRASPLDLAPRHGFHSLASPPTKHNSGAPPRPSHPSRSQGALCTPPHVRRPILIAIIQR